MSPSSTHSRSQRFSCPHHAPLTCPPFKARAQPRPPRCPAPGPQPTRLSPTGRSWPTGPSSVCIFCFFSSFCLSNYIPGWKKNPLLEPSFGARPPAEAFTCLSHPIRTSSLPPVPYQPHFQTRKPRLSATGTYPSATPRGRKKDEPCLLHPKSQVLACLSLAHPLPRHLWGLRQPRRYMHLEKNENTLNPGLGM